LDAAKTAIDAVLQALNAECAKPFLRQLSAKSADASRPTSGVKLLK